jgi:hypothetical protein
MGYYIQTQENTGKAARICDSWADTEIISSAPASYQDIPEGKALVVVVENQLFEAAGVVYNEQEFRAFTDTVHDHRPRTYLLMDRALAFKLAGVPERYLGA